MRMIIGFVIGIVLCGSGVEFEAQEPEKLSTFLLKVDGDTELSTNGRKDTIDGNTEILYSWKSKGDERTLVFKSIAVNLVQNEKELVNSLMSREKMIAYENGERIEITLADGPDEIKQILTDSFDSPICTLQVDKDFAEKNRKVTAGPGAKDLVDRGMIVTGILCHPPYLKGAKIWKARREISMGNGGIAEGEFTYRKISDDEERYEVTGTLGNEEYKLPGRPVTMANAKYVVRGEQTYDPTINEWVAAKLDLDVSFDFVVDGKTMASAKGTIGITMKLQEAENTSSQ